MAPLRLTIEPIPNSSRLTSLSKLLPPARWDALRRTVYRQARYRCQACGREGRLHCHEVWHYAEQTNRQWLAGFLALCPDCHDAKHITTVYNDAQRARLLRHFLAVNGLTPSEGESCLRAALDRQRWLDQRHWVVDYGAYNASVPCLYNTECRRGFLQSANRCPSARRAPRSLLAPEAGQAWEAQAGY